MTDDYKTNSGVQILSETTNIFNITPEIKISSNILNINPYLVFSYNYNIYSGGKLSAKVGNTISPLPNVEVENYFESRFGLNKTFNEIIKLYGEVIATKGDKESFGGQIGIEYKF